MEVIQVEEVEVGGGGGGWNCAVVLLMMIDEAMHC